MAKWDVKTEEQRLREINAQLMEALEKIAAEATAIIDNMDLMATGRTSFIGATSRHASRIRRLVAIAKEAR